MANYECYCRTNYFRVTNEEKYQELFGRLSSEYGVDDYSTTKDGVLLHGFGAYSPLTLNHIWSPEEKTKLVKEIIESYMPDDFFSENGELLFDFSRADKIYVKRNDTLMLIFDAYHPERYDDNLDCDEGIYEFAELLQPLLPDGECMIYQEIGHEKMRYLVGEALMVTRNHIAYHSLNEWVKEKQTEWGVTSTPCSY